MAFVWYDPSGITATATSTYPGNSIYRIFDASAHSYWLTASGGVPVTIHLDLGAGNEEVIARFDIQASDVNQPNRMINDGVFEGSNNDADWDLLHTITDETAWGNAEQRSFEIAAPASYRYYRLIISTVNGDVYAQIGEFYLYTSSTVPRLALVDMLYGNAVVNLLSGLDMPYTIFAGLVSLVGQVYGIQAAAFLRMYYGDAFVRQAVDNQYYSNCPELLRAWGMRYGDLLPLCRLTAMGYDIFAGVGGYMEMAYGLSGEDLRRALDQAYSVSVNNPIRAGMFMPYLLQSDNITETVTVSLAVAGIDVPLSFISIEASRDSYVVSGEAGIAELADYLRIAAGDEAEVVVNGFYYRLVVESKKRSRPGTAQVRYMLSLVSPAIALSLPWSLPLQMEFAADTAENILNELAGDLGPVDYRTESFPVLSDTLYANDEDRLTVMRKLSRSVGAVIQSSPDGTIVIEPEYPVPVSRWDSSLPDYFLTDERNFISQDETPLMNSGENKYLVSNELAASDRIWTEQERVSAALVLVMGFQVPWDDSLVVKLSHSGGGEIPRPEYMGVVEETWPPLDREPEQVEFVAGYASVDRAVYGDLTVAWLREQLGAVTYAEDGRLEAEVKDGATSGYSLAAVRYTTRYHLWRVQNSTAVDVQYILWVQ